MTISGGIMDFIGAFGAGVLVSFTPCVYPVMPLTASFIAGANTKGSKRRAFFISLIYVLGMAVIYSALAIFAALTGKIFGQIQNTPAFYLTAAVLLIAFAFMMFDKIPMPMLLKTGAPKIKPDNLWAVFGFGMASGLIIGPCTAPMLGTLLVYIAGQQNLIHGAALMFCFAYGIGFSLILVGTFSGLLSRLPKSGLWLVRVKQVSGLILLFAGLYFIYKAILVMII